MFKKFLSLFLAFALSGIFFIEGGEVGEFENEGFKGVSWKEVVPVKKIAFVGFNESSYIDDYAYIAAIPASTFLYNGKLYSYPLLYYEKREISDKKELSLNASQGIKYFLEDWINYCGDLKAELINCNVKIPNTTYINSTNIYEIASEIATKHWLKSNEVFVAIADDFEGKKEVKGEKSCFISQAKVGYKKLKVAEPEGIGGIYEEFTIEKPYKYVEVLVEWNPLLRGIDIDLQLYDDALGMVDASENWNALVGTYEKVESYVFNYGKWEIGLTNMPTENAGVMGEMINNLFKKGREYEAKIILYPGGEISLPYMNFARNVNISIECNKNVSFGAILLSSSKIAYKPYKGKGKIDMHFDELGKDNYSICIFAMENSSGLNFKINYEWEEWEEKQVKSFASCAQAAILASLHNAPLLYVKENEIPHETNQAIRILGAKKIYVIEGNEELLEKLSIFGDVENLSLFDAYNQIYDITKSHDIVFSTASPWTYWLAEELQPKGIKEKALYVGPATYMAVHHGSALFIVEEHKKLHQAASWITDFWKRDSRARLPPPVACMYLMAKQVYDFISSLGLDKEGHENILTVAGQFDIGIGWDRAFVGKANPGRILGTPVDTSYWIARSIFYPALIFQNPALNPNGIMLINGSKSRRDALGRLHILKPSKEEHFLYPVLQTWVSYCHEFNKEASKYWGCLYTTRDGIIPYVTPSSNPIDEGATDKIGAYWPDMSTSEVVPFYLKKLGYSNVFSTNFSATMENLNRGAIMWFEGMHAAHVYGGIVGFWDPNANWTKIFYYLKDVPGIKRILEKKKINTEPNPWRGYEFGIWRQALFRWGIPFTNKCTQIFQTGSTENPDVIVMDKFLGWDWRTALHGDGVVIAILQQVATETKTGFDIDKALDNLHSCGINAGISCFIAATYLHLALIRHGSVFQIIDPWLTSWYCNFAVEMFARYLAMGYTAGEAYEKAMRHVGICYLTKEWWWDVSENVCYFGDPCLRIWSPANAWEEPVAIEPGIVGNHII